MRLRSLAAAGFLTACLAAGLASPFQAAAAEHPGRLDLPSFSHLQSKATEVVDVTLGAWPLALASKFMEADDAEGVELKKLISGIKSIVVRSYEFDSDFAYSKEDVAAVRAQLAAPAWTQLAQVRKRGKDQEVDLDVYIALDADQAKGFAIVASEPRKFTILNIVGTINLDQVAKLQHHMDLHVDLDDALESTP
ncbi:MAG TPA: DUF4252 domain-containing protein [Steroidobacteraceae bacterium]|nr:DUF4252 domain-containing protein [Steroidobacteraceae bacterium]